jgi:hypothetical protein
MTTVEMAEYVRDELLNRMSEDDLFAYPDDYHAALTRAAKFYRDRIASHYPELLYETDPVSGDSAGEVYAMDDDHMGELEVWTPPGPPSGYLLSNVLPDSGVFGYYVEGRNIILTSPRVYTPGLYVRRVPATFTDLDGTNNSPLPSYCDEVICQRAAYLMAKKPGFLGNPRLYEEEAIKLWSGDRSDPSDMGVLGIISRQNATQGHQTAADLGSMPWYKRIPS